MVPRCRYMCAAHPHTRSPKVDDGRRNERYGEGGAGLVPAGKIVDKCFAYAVKAALALLIDRLVIHICPIFRTLWIPSCCNLPT